MNTCGVANGITLALLTATLVTACQQDKPAMGPTVEIGICITESVAIDVVAGKSWSVCVLDAINKCGIKAVCVVDPNPTDCPAALVERVWASQEKAIIAQGFIPRAIPGRGRITQ